MILLKKCAVGFFFFSSTEVKSKHVSPLASNGSQVVVSADLELQMLNY